MRKIIFIFGGTLLIITFLMDAKILHEFSFSELIEQKKITKINILNLNYLDEAYILNSIKINENQEFWSFNKQQLKNELYKINEVKNFKFELLPSGVLNIQIEENHPFVLWNDGERIKYLDKKGEILKFNHSFQNLITVYGKGVDKQIQKLVSIFSEQNNLNKNTEKIYFYENVGWKFDLQSGKCILIPIQDLKKSIDIIDNIKRLEFFEIFNKIDLRINGRIYLSEARCLN